MRREKVGPAIMDGFGLEYMRSNMGLKPINNFDGTGTIFE